MEPVGGEKNLLRGSGDCTGGGSAVAGDALGFLCERGKGTEVPFPSPSQKVGCVVVRGPIKK